jgi:hypothetical protein
LTCGAAGEHAWHGDGRDGEEESGAGGRGKGSMNEKKRYETYELGERLPSSRG